MARVIGRANIKWFGFQVIGPIITGPGSTVTTSGANIADIGIAITMTKDSTIVTTTGTKQSPT
jgi:hypothetical protein